MRKSNSNKFSGYPNAGHLLQPAFVLHTRPYRDTSFLVELLTVYYGRITVVARGARSMRSKFYGLLSPFWPLLVSFTGKGELRTLQYVEICGGNYSFDHKTLVSGLYLNELLIKLLPAHESYVEVYQMYHDTLNVLATTTKNHEISLRLFEKCLLANLGYGLDLQRTRDDQPLLPEKFYNFVFGSGFMPVAVKAETSFLGRSLLALHLESFTTPDELRDAKRLLRSVFTILLGHKRIRSRELFFEA